MYMSYCRCEGALHEVRAIMGQVDDHLNGDAEHGMSYSEIQRFKDLVEEFTGWLADIGILSEMDLDTRTLDEVCKKMEEGYEDAE